MTPQLEFTTNQQGEMDIHLSLPIKQGRQFFKIIRGILGITAVANNSNNEERDYSFAEVFPNDSPATALRGLRGKENLTQEQLADRLGITQTVVSDLENGKRPISVKMAKKIAKEFNFSYKTFL